MKIVIAGCGFTGLETARLFHRAGWEVLGLTHSADSAATLAAEPFRVIACDIADVRALEKSGAQFPKTDAVIHCASSAHGGVSEYRRVYLDGARNILDVLQPKTFVFTSSTSVYAQTAGERVTEESPAEPARETGRILREAEDLALAHRGIVARLAGIYGPGRAVLLQKFLENRAVIEGDGLRVINQIHRDDAARALLFLVAENAPAGIYNVGDDTPLTQLEFYERLAARFGRPLPPRGPIDPNRKRGWTSKRVSNTKLRALGWRPLFPAVFDALETIF
jgi:nucleoside-diphosphate-sugar epimerase